MHDTLKHPAPWPYTNIKLKDPNALKHPAPWHCTNINLTFKHPETPYVSPSPNTNLRT